MNLRACLIEVIGLDWIERNTAERTGAYLASLIQVNLNNSLARESAEIRCCGHNQTPRMT
jgi:hypothetical protein